MRIVSLFIVFILASSFTLACSLDIASKNTADFLTEIPQLDSNLQGCPVPLNTASKLLLGSNSALKMSITDTSDVFVTISGATLSGMSTTGTKYGFLLMMDSCTLDAVLNSDSQYGAFAYLYTQENIQIKAKGFWNSIKFLAAKSFFNSAMKKAAQPVTLNC